MRAYLLKLVVAMVAFGLAFNLAFYMWLSHSPLLTAVESYASASPTISNVVGSIYSLTPSVFGAEISEFDQSGRAQLTVVIRAAKSTRRATVSAVKQDGVWSVGSVVLRD